MPAQTIRRAVMQTGGSDMERALQLLLDGNVLDEGIVALPWCVHTYFCCKDFVPTGPEAKRAKSSGDEQRFIFNEKKEKARSGLSDSQEIYLMLQQEEALMYK